MIFKKKPVEIEAIQWKGDNWDDIFKFTNKETSLLPTSEKILVDTLEGSMKANVGDWIIKGVTGEFYPCKPDIFDMTYDKVEEER